MLRFEAWMLRFEASMLRFGSLECCGWKHRYRQAALRITQDIAFSDARMFLAVSFVKKRSAGAVNLNLRYATPGGGC